MRKRLVLSLATISMILLVTAVCNPASATSYAVGVKVGDTADYTASATGEPFSKMHLSVYGIVGTVVTLNLTYYYPNGTLHDQSTVTGDLLTGSGGILLFLIARNLTQGDPVYSGSTMKVNKTVTMTVAGASRSVNYVNLTMGYWQFYWDKETGLMTQVRFLFFGWMNLTLTSTSLWSAGLFGLSWTTLAIIGGGAVVLIAVVALVLRRRK